MRRSMGRGVVRSSLKGSNGAQEAGKEGKKCEGDLLLRRRAVSVVICVGEKGYRTGDASECGVGGWRVLSGWSVRRKILRGVGHKCFKVGVVRSNLKYLYRGGGGSEFSGILRRGGGGLGVQGLYRREGWVEKEGYKDASNYLKRG
eukprot:750339-Hanusia_phi.AAC.2